MHNLGSTKQDIQSEQDLGKFTAAHTQTWSLAVTAILILFRQLLVNETNYKEGILVFNGNVAPPPALISFHLLEIRYFLFAVHGAQ